MKLPPKAKSVSPVTLKVGDTTLEDPQDISESFNNFFANVASSILDNMENHHRAHMITLSILLILKLMIVCLSMYLLWIMNMF